MYGLKDSTLIEHSLFVDLIALMALEMNYPEPEPSTIEKILIFIEKISQSQGPGKIVLNTGNRQANCGNFLEFFKEIYPGFFNEEKNEEEDFSTIMQNNEDDFENNMKNNNENNINELDANNDENNNNDNEINNKEINNNNDFGDNI